MEASTWTRIGNWRWWIERNPTYLLSAVMMALGARLYLDTPHSRAGDVGLILLTLGILQTYKWAVAGALALLHWKQRSPEDKPWLMLVSALFWTGPLAATAEMTARTPRLGLGLAIAVGLFAVTEFSGLVRLLKLRVTIFGRACAYLGLLFLVLTPQWIRVPATADGSNELVLYGAWWCLAFMALLGIGSVHHQARFMRRSQLPWEAWHHFQIETAFLVIMIGALVSQLTAMNYAFFGHGRLFYAAPLLASVSAAGVEFMTRLRFRDLRMLYLFLTLPVVAIAISFGQYDPKIPLDRLWWWLRNPLCVGLLLAAASWWYAAWRRRSVPLLHLGGAAFIWAIFEWMTTGNAAVGQEILTPSRPITISRDMIVIFLYAITAYLVVVGWLKRAPLEGFAALCVHQVAITIWIWGFHPADAFVIMIAAGWHILIGLHLFSPQPRARILMAPVAYLCMVNWGFDQSPTIDALAGAHVALMLAALLSVSLYKPSYCPAALIACLANALYFGGQRIGELEHPLAATLVIVSFIMLAAGVFISWHKPRILQEDEEEWEFAEE